MCAGDELYATSTSLVGSIGVISAQFGFVDIMKRLGLERRVYKAGDAKDLLDPFRSPPQHDSSVPAVTAFACPFSLHSNIRL
jgi:serine protease SohB